MTSETTIETAMPILVIGDDMRIFLSVVRSLGRAGRIVHAFPFAKDAPALVSRYIAKIHDTPDYEADRAGWRNTLLSLLKTTPFDLVIPCADPAIIHLDLTRDILSHQRLAIPERNNMAVFFDKEETHRLCEELDVAHTTAARLAADDTVDGLISRFGLPVVLKPRRSFWVDKGKARDDVVIAVDREQLADALASIGDRTRYLVEGYFSGNGTGVSVLCDNGTVLQAFQHRRLREGWGGCSSYRISEQVHPELRHAVERVCQKTAHTGVCMFEFRVNPETGKWVLLEINARFWGSMALPLALGFDFPNWLHELVVTRRRAEPQSYEAGVRSRNLLLDANNLRKGLIRGGISGLGSWLGEALDFLVQPLRWILGRETPDSLAFDDPAPAIREIRSVFHRPIRRGTEDAAPAGIETSVS